MKFKKIIVQFIILFCIFDILPLFFILKEDYKNPPVFLLLGVFPLINFAVGLFTGIKNGFFAYSILVPILCITASCVFYFSSGSILWGIFFVLMYILGMSLGYLIYRSNPKNKGD